MLFFINIMCRYVIGHALLLTIILYLRPLIKDKSETIVGINPLIIICGLSFYSVYISIVYAIVDINTHNFFLYLVKISLFY